MTYELAKQLKNAGYNGYLHFNGDGTVNHDLSELIEACESSYDDDGVTFNLTIRKSGDHWVASYQSQSLESGRGFSLGDTPEEAVAKLWLSLNK